jgi:acyl-CoA reductase-like NAD-dependent aldehyde dehydrogenase
MVATMTPPSGQHITVRSPSTGDVLGSVPVLDEKDVHALVQRARAVQPAWAARGIKERARVLMVMRARIAERAEEVARLSCAETGKLPLEALLSDVQVTCDLAKWYARRAQPVLGKHAIPSGWLLTKRAYEIREPYGVVAVIGPWNFPVLNCMRSVLAALVCGNTVVLKPSEASPLSALLMRNIADDVGIPADVFLVATGDGVTGAALVAADIDKLSFTGSVDTGRRIARAAAERLLPLSLELGGKDAMIVLDGADIKRAADAAVAGAFLNAGQICTSIERVYVDDKVYDDFVARVVKKTEKLQVGTQHDADADVGAITVELQIEKIESQVNDAVAQGATALTGGSRVHRSGRFYAPTVLTNVTQDMRVMREETFGPVLPIMRVSNAQEAIRLANDSPFALGGSIWAKPQVAHKLVPQLRAGMVSINDTLLNGMVAGLPFGGLKDSGYGRVYGDDALREMSWPRGVTVDRAGLREIGYYPLRRFGTQRALGLVQAISGSGARTKLRGLLRVLMGT